jgi:ribose transport system permease protein
MPGLRAALARGPIWLAVLLLYALASLVSPAFLSGAQLRNLLQVAAFLGVVSLGQTIALLAGGIDLSVGGVVTLTNVLSTSIMDGRDGAVPLAVVACLAAGLLVGAVNGVLVAWMRVSPLIATLSLNAVLFGAALLYTGGAPHGTAAPGFALAGQGTPGGVPASALCWLVAALAVLALLGRTVFGRWLYAVGANPVAAHLMGVPVRLVLLAAYGISASMAVLGGLLVTAYIGNPSLGIGDQFQLTSIAAAVVGGTALTGGIGGVAGTMGGALFITEANSFTNIAHLSSGAQYVVQGAIIALSVLVYRAVAPRAA